MTDKSNSKKIFFGWWTVLASGVVAFLAHGCYSYGISALFKPISSDLGFSRAGTSVASSIGRFEGGLEAPVVGWITDRFGPRWVIMAGVFLMGTGFILMNFIDSIWAFYLIWGIMVGTGVNIISLPTDVAISNWFVKKRGLAISIKWVLSGLGGTVILPIISWLIIQYGWRTTCMICGFAICLMGLPLTTVCFKSRRPEYYGLLPDGVTQEDEGSEGNEMIAKGVKYAEEVDEVEFTLRQALVAPAFWLLIVGQTGSNLATTAITMHGIPFLTDIGIDPVKASGMMAIMVAAGIPSRFISGFLADRVGKNGLRYLLGGAYFIQATGFAIFLLHQNLAMIYAWFVCYGIGQGFSFTLNSILRARYFGRKAFGSIGGVSRMFMTPIGMASPIYVGWVYDSTGSYIGAFTLVTILLFGASIMMSLIPPPKTPEMVTDINQIT